MPLENYDNPITLSSVQPGGETVAVQFHYECSDQQIEAYLDAEIRLPRNNNDLNAIVIDALRLLPEVLESMETSSDYRRWQNALPPNEAP